MAKATRTTKAKGVDNDLGRRRGGRHALPEINGGIREQEIKNESGESVNESAGNEKPRPRTRAKRRLTDSLPAADLRRSKRIKPDNVPNQHGQVKGEGKEKTAKKHIKREDDESPASPPPPVKAETDDDDDTTIIDSNNNKLAGKAIPSKAKTGTDLQAKKLKSYSQFAAARQSPYPDFARPTAADCKRAHAILVSLHGARVRPEDVGQRTTAPTSRAGCGESTSVLDALVRTILSQNTSEANSARAKLSMDAAYGGSDSNEAWARIADGGQAKLAAAIASGGLAGIKSRAILDILAQTRARHGAYSLDHLFGAPDGDAMRELLGFRGVGPKTASCVLLFCLRRASFAVDTHVHRIAGLLGWRPPSASRDQAHAHLDARVPDEDKYGLHVLLVRHGRECAECRAGGKYLGRCELRRAFGKGGVEGTEKEEEEEIQTEEDVDGDVKG